MTDFLKYVPKELEANLEYRIALRYRAAKDLGFRKALMTACRHDILFWLNAFVFLHEPREYVVNGRAIPHVIPFLTRPHQDVVFRALHEHLGTGDVGVKKSRGEGMSWAGCMVGLHDWIFRHDVTVGMCSATEEKADKPGDRGSLMGKIDWELTMLPEWMVGKAGQDWKRIRSDHTLHNLRNGSLLVAHAATAGTGRGHRYRWFLLDELSEWREGDDEAVLASLQHATESRLIVATPQGSKGAYYEMMHEPSNMVKLTLEWKDNPERNRGLYRFEGPFPVAVDPVGNPLPADYSPPSPEVFDLFARLRSRGYRMDGIRSPWYDRECDRARATPQSIAQELDMDFGGSMYRIFGQGFFSEVNKTSRGPIRTGMITYDPETLSPEWDDVENGPCLMWGMMADGCPEPGRYVAGADVSSGLGGSHTSNSALVVLNAHTGEQVFEFAVNTMPPGEFADFCMAACKWFHDAHLGWEINGPGAGFSKRVEEQGYSNVYMRDKLWKRSKKKERVVGWYTRRDTKEIMFDAISREVRRSRVAIRSRELGKECEQYVRSGDKIDHVMTARSDDSSKGQAHGDRVIALGVAIQAMLDRPSPVASQQEERVEVDIRFTMAGRMREYEEALARDRDPWDDRSNWDLSGRNMTYELA